MTADRRNLERAAKRKGVLLFVAMVAAVLSASIVLYVDARHEGAEALSDFASEQESIAEALALSESTASAIEERHKSIVVMRGADGALRRPNGHVVVSQTLAVAMAAAEHTVTLTRPEAAALGLPERTAVAGIAQSHSGQRIAVVATALRVRDREERAQDRLLLGIALSALLTGIFGGIALRVQRKELVLERELLLRDTERRGEERLARADKLATMGALATGIAHEIATPLGVIAARSEMLSPRVQADERAARALANVIEQVEKIRGIIKSFLALARGEAPTPTRLDARDVLAGAASMVEHRYGAAAVRLDVDAPAVSVAVFGDKRLLEQALVNLLLNACDASRAGQTVRASLRLDEGRAVFRVEDDGPSISADVAERATEPFFTTKPPGRGTGLGLAIANEIATHHQGRFLIRPRASGGTEARLELPAADPSKEKAA